MCTGSDVAPYMGAWVENKRQIQTYYELHLTWVRGLKEISLEIYDVGTHNVAPYIGVWVEIM